MLTWLLLMTIGGFLLGCAAIIATIFVLLMICGCLSGCAAIHQNFFNRLDKMKYQVPKIRKYSSRTIEA